jgi:hypothetical protein
MIHKDETCPEFCPLTPLLTYIWASNIKGGSLFPETSELLHWAGSETDKSQLLAKEIVVTGTNDGKFVTQWTYNGWLNLLKEILKTHCGMVETECSRVGTHTLRKTAYLFAVWGILQMLNRSRKRGGSDDNNDAQPTKLSELWENEIMKSARHRSIANASRYIQDAFSLHGISARERFQEENFVSKFEGIIVNCSSRNNAKQLMVHSKPNQKRDIILQTAWWIKNVVRETATRNAEELLRVALIPRDPQPDLVESLLALVIEEKRDFALPLIHRLVREKASGLHDGGDGRKQQSVPEMIALDIA